MYWRVKCVLIQWEYRCIGAGEGKPPYMQIATSLLVQSGLDWTEWI